MRVHCGLRTADLHIYLRLRLSGVDGGGDDDDLICFARFAG